MLVLGLSNSKLLCYLPDPPACLIGVSFGGELVVSSNRLIGNELWPGDAAAGNVAENPSMGVDLEMM